MKFSGLLYNACSSILRKPLPTCTCVYRVPGQRQVKRDFFTSRYPQYSEAEEFEFEDTSCLDDIREIAGDDPDKMQHLTILAAEADFLRHSGASVPNKLRPKDWEELLTMPHKDDRVRLYSFLYTNEKKALMAKLRSAEKAQILEIVRKNRESRSSLNRTTSSPIEYGLVFNSIFQRIRDQKMKMYWNYRLLKSEMFGPHLVFDCSYESKMSKLEQHHCGMQLLYSISANRQMDCPFNIIHCNFDVNGEVMKQLKEVIRDMSEMNILFKYTEKSYLDLFPSNKLIYLSPHSENVMEKYEPGCIYIIGAFVDELVHEPLSLAKAKEHGLRTARFPIDEHVNWCQGSQLLPINQCVEILNDLKNNLSWKEAFRRIALRKTTYSSPNYKGKRVGELRNSYIKEVYPRKNMRLISSVDEHILTPETLEEREYR